MFCGRVAVGQGGSQGQQVGGAGSAGVAGSGMAENPKLVRYSLHGKAPLAGAHT